MTQAATYDPTEMTLVMDSDGVEVRRAEAGPDMTLVWIRCPAGTDFGPALAGLPHDMCCCEHWGMITEGRMDIVTHDGREFSLEAGNAFHLLPGHLPSFPSDCAWYEFSPTEHVDRLFTHMGLA